jgi:RNA polymerase sigma factor (sigma-70 family)
VATDDYSNNPSVDGYTHLFKDHYHRVIRFVMHMGASQRDAEDAAQEAFYEALVLSKSKPDDWNEIKSKAAWLRTVALRRYRRPPGPRRGPLILVSDVPDRPAPGSGHEDDVAHVQDVLRALRTLPEEELPVAAFDLDGIPTSDIAHALGMTEQRVRDIRKKYRAKLKRELGGNTVPGGRR